MLPADNHELLMNDYYEDEGRFGRGASVYIGVESADAFSVESLQYLRKLKNGIDALNAVLPAKNIAKALGLSVPESQKIVDAARSQGVNEQSFVTIFFPILKDPEQASKTFAWDQAFAKKVTHAIRTTDPSVLYQLVETPIKKIESLVDADYIANRDEALVSEKIVAEDSEITSEVAQQVKAKAASWDVYRDTLYSRDGTLSGMVIRLNSTNIDMANSIVEAIQIFLTQHPQVGIKAYLDGESVIATEMGTTMRSDLKLLMPLVILVVLLVLFLCFRSVQGVLYPMVVVLMGVVCSLGAMGWLKIPVSIASVTLPPLMVAIASAYGIHQVNHYLLDSDTDKLRILQRNLKVVGLAILLSGITVMVGFGALAVEDFVPVRNFGLFTAWGDLVAVAAALWVLPALILIGKKPKTIHYHESSKGAMEKLLRALVGLNRHHRGKVIVFTILVTIVFAIGMISIRSELNNVSFFKNDSPVHVADDKLNQKLAGSQTVSIVLDSDLNPPHKAADGSLEPSPSNGEPVVITTPEVLKKVEAFSVAVKNEFPYVGKVLSFDDVLKKMNQEMNGGSPEFYKIPDDPNLISQYLLIFSGDIQSQVSGNHDKLRISISLKRVGTEDSEKVATFARQYFDSAFLQRNHLQLNVTGAAHLYYVANSLLMDGMIKSIVICVALVFLLLLLLLRNLRMTLIGLIPIASTLIINFGLLGLLHIPLNTATAMVSSIAVGIGVDYSIHFITWYRAEVQKNRDITKALENSILHKGRAILYNMFVIVAGFLVLLVSNFVPLIQFGFLVAICMFTTAFGALVVVPAVIRMLAKKDRPFLYLDSKAAKPEKS